MRRAQRAQACKAPRPRHSERSRDAGLGARQRHAHRISGRVSNWWKGGGEGSVHSSVVAPAPQGLAPAGTLRAKACAKPNRNISTPMPDTYEPTEETRFQSAKASG